MKSLNQIKQYTNQIKQSFVDAEQQTKEIESYIENLKARKDKLDQSTSVNDIDKLVDINSKLDAANKMLEKSESDSKLLKEEIGTGVYAELFKLRSDYYQECKKEAEPLYREIIKKVKEFEDVINKFNSYGEEKSNDLKNAVESISHCVSIDTRRKLRSREFSSIVDHLEHTFPTYQIGFRNWKEKIEK